MKRITSIILSVIMLLSSLLMLASCSAVDGVNGADGIDGIDGKDGLVPSVGENGNWWIGDTDTGVSAYGAKGDKGDVGAAGNDAQKGKDGADVTVYPIFRLNAITNNFEVSYDDGETWTSIGAASNNFNPNAGFSYPMDRVEMLEGIIDSSKKYVVANQSNGGRHGAVIDLKDFNHKYVKIVKSSSNTSIKYAFLKDELVLDSAVSFATGYTSVKTSLNQTETVTIPTDAKYLYVVYNEYQNVHLPSSITFTNKK